MRLYAKPIKRWNTAYYQENMQSPFKFEYEEAANEDMVNPYSNMDERRIRLQILTYSEIKFRVDDKVFINNIEYIISYIEPKPVKELLNRPLFKSKDVGKVLHLVY